MVGGVEDDGLCVEEVLSGEVGLAVGFCVGKLLGEGSLALVCVNK